MGWLSPGLSKKRDQFSVFLKKSRWKSTNSRFEILKALGQMQERGLGIWHPVTSCLSVFIFRNHALAVVDERRV